jgi:hypothetical protein
MFRPPYDAQRGGDREGEAREGCTPGFPADRATALVAGILKGARPQLQAMIHSVEAGCGPYLYIRN